MGLGVKKIKRLKDEIASLFNCTKNIATVLFNRCRGWMAVVGPVNLGYGRHSASKPQAV